MNEDILVRVGIVEESITMYASEVGNRHMASGGEGFGIGLFTGWQNGR